MARVWKLDLPPSEKLILLAYADHADNDGASIFPSIRSIARKTGFSSRWVQQLTRKLHRMGHLEDDGMGPRGTRRWRIPLRGKDVGASPEMGELRAGLQSRAAGGVLRSGVKPDVSGGELPFTRAVKPDAARGELEFAKGANTGSPEPSLIIKEPPMPAAPAEAEFETANAIVRSQPAPAPRVLYTNRDLIPDQYLALADVFHEVTGLTPARTVMTDWRREFSIWLSEGIEPQHVRQAHKEAGGRISITRPGSLTRLAAAVKARGRAAGSAVKDAEWHRRADEHTERSVAEGRRRAAEWYRSHNMPYEDPETMQPRIENLPSPLGVKTEVEPVVRASEEARAKLRELVMRLTVNAD